MQGPRADRGRAQQDQAQAHATIIHVQRLDKWQQRMGLTSRMPNAVAGWSV